MESRNRSLSHYLSHLTMIEHDAKVKELAAKCHVPRKTIYNWKYGRCRIPDLYMSRIEMVVGYPIFGVSDNT